MPLPHLASGRFRFRAALLLVAVAWFWRVPASAETPVHAFPHGVASGDVTATSVVLWASTLIAGDHLIQLSTDADFNALWASADVAVSDPQVPIKHRFEALPAATRFFYRFVNPDGESAAGVFRTAAMPDTVQGLRFGVSGDWRGDLSPFPAVKNVPARDLDFFVKLGDTVYADVPSPALDSEQARTLEEFRLKHAEIYTERHGLNAFAALQASTAVFATIDDHDVIRDFSGGAAFESDPRFEPGNGPFINDTPLYRNAMRAFIEFNPMAEEVHDLPDHPRFHGKPDLFRARWFGRDAALFVLDARSFRDAPLAGVSDPTDVAATAAFLSRSFDLDPVTGEALPRRTMLGRPQLDRLKAELLRAHDRGMVWKFICVPEPIQNLSAAGAPDRFEGYAAERAELMDFIHSNQIENVVFIAADIHGTIINNLTYQLHPDDFHIPTGAFEVTTGPVAYDPPFGPTILNIAAGISVTPLFTLLDAFLIGVGAPDLDTFESDFSVSEKNAAVHDFANLLLIPGGYDSIGLEGSPIRVIEEEGGYVNVFSYGWTEFDISPESGALTVTVYGVDSYSAAEIGAGTADLEPVALSRHRIAPAPLSGPRLSVSLANGDVLLSWPAFWSGFELQTAAAIPPDSEWTGVEIEESLEGGTRTVRIPDAGGGSRYFRLSR